MPVHRFLLCGILLLGILGIGGRSLDALAHERGPATDTTTSLRVMTFNIRFNNPDDGVHAWPHRKDRVASVIRFHQADVVGLQEALKEQIDELSELLPEYAWFGEGREGGMQGEFSPVFYRDDRLDVLEQATFWLSETPDVPGSRGWDAALPRIVTWALFCDEVTQDSFYVFNTHFDHVGEQARAESARLLLERIDAVAGSVPVVVTGDFNATPSSEPYRVLTGNTPEARALPRNVLQDAIDRSATPHHGPLETFQGFVVDPAFDGRRIDYVFVGPGVEVNYHGVLTDQWHGHYPSDHLPVLAEIVLP